MEGEFRAPGSHGPGFDGPGTFRWFCLDHVREFNAGYDWFEGMSADEIYAAQAPSAGWANASRAFRGDAGIDGVPRWADFEDPLEAIAARAAHIRSRAQGRAQTDAKARREDRANARRFTLQEREALGVMGLSPSADRPALRRRYSDLVRHYHPDRNGGDRSFEGRLQSVVEAYQLLRKANALD